MENSTLYGISSDSGEIQFCETHSIELTVDGLVLPHQRRKITTHFETHKKNIVKNNDWNRLNFLSKHRLKHTCRHNVKSNAPLLSLSSVKSFEFSWSSEVSECVVCVCVTRPRIEIGRWSVHLNKYTAQCVLPDERLKPKTYYFGWRRQIWRNLFQSVNSKWHTFDINMCVKCLCIAWFLCFFFGFVSMSQQGFVGGKVPRWVQSPTCHDTWLYSSTAPNTQKTMLDLFTSGSMQRISGTCQFY